MKKLVLVLSFFVLLVTGFTSCIVAPHPYGYGYAPHPYWYARPWGYHPYGGYHGGGHGYHNGHGGYHGGHARR